ncbi:MAG: ribosome silencing factor [Flavobacteriales bacterium]|nr:ribosome silencing factor [Flavobacteriales bacterium]
MTVKKPLLDSIVKGIEEGKGEEIVIMDLRNVQASVCDYFVVCHGNSSTQTESIARKVVEQTEKQSDERPWRGEGFTNANWILLDYVDIVVHVFYKETRAFYDIEELWADAAVTYIDEKKETSKKSGTS